MKNLMACLALLGLFALGGCSSDQSAVDTLRDASDALMQAGEIVGVAEQAATDIADQLEALDNEGE